MAITAIALLGVARLWLYFSSTTILPLGWQWSSVGVGIALGIGITALSGVIYRLWPAYRASANVYLLMILPALLWPDLLWLGLLPGLSEELLFRGVILPSFGLNGAGVVLSSVIFGSMHFSGMQQWPYIVWASIIGMVLGASAIASHGLLVPVVAHITTNLLSSCLWKWKNSAPAP